MTFGFLPKEKITSGSGLLGLARNFGASWGVSIAATMLARRSQVHQAMLVSHLAPGNPNYRAALIRGTQLLFQHGMSLADATTAAAALLGQQLERHAMMLSYIDTFWLLAMGSFLVAPVPLLIRKPKVALSATQIKEAAAHAE